MNIADYTPIDIIQDARSFLDQMNSEVSMVARLKMMGMLKTTPEADAFVAWWNLGCYGEYPHSLILLYENDKPICDFYGPYDAQNVKDFVIYRMESFYYVLKENSMIEECTDGNN